MTTNEILAKVQKLLALSTSPNEHEASLATEKAHELLAQYNLVLADVPEGKQEADAKIGKVDAESKHQSPWVRHLWNSVARLYFCSYAASASRHRTQHVIVGSPANTATAIHMGHYLQDTIIRLAKVECYGETNRYKQAFIKGCAMRVTARLHERKANLESGKETITNTGNLPMIYESNQHALDAFTANLGWTSGRSRRMSHSSAAGHAAGRSAGNNVGLDQQVGKASRSTQRQLT